MYSIRVATTDDRELPVAEDWPNLTWERLVDVLRIEISPEAAALFAEPIADPSRGVTHWHVVALDEPKPLHALTPQEREALLARFQKLQADIRAYADRLNAAGGETNLRLAHGLLTAVELSDQHGQLWSVNGAPLLTGWGRQRTGAGAAAPTILTRAAKDAEASADLRGRAFIPGVTHVFLPPAIMQRLKALTPARWDAASWLLWLPFWLVVGATLYNLLPACSIDLPLLRGLSHCALAAPLDELESRNHALRRAVFEEQKRLAALCAQTPRPEPAPPSSDKTKARLEENRLKSGRLDITLAWDGREDLDLHVHCGEGHLYHGQRSACGGVLDHDANFREPIVDHPVEHATWDREPSRGLYLVTVKMSSRNGAPERSTPFTVLVRSDGKEQLFNGVINGADETPVTTLDRRGAPSR